MPLLPRWSRVGAASRRVRARRSFRPTLELLDERALPAVGGLSTAGSVQAPLGSAFSAVLASFPSADVSGPSLAAALPHLHALIDWGDGNTTAGSIAGPDAAGNLTVSGTNTYQAAQTFPVTVTVTDDRDQSHVSTLALVSTVPGGPLGTGGPLPGTADASGTLGVTPVPVNATAGQPFVGIVAVVQDATPGATGANLAAIVDWGDGTGIDVVPVQPSGTPGVFNVVDSHFYLAGGTSTFGIWVEDLTNGRMTFASGPVTVADAPPPGPAPAPSPPTSAPAPAPAAASQPAGNDARPFQPLTEAQAHFFGFWAFTHHHHRRYWHRFTMFRPSTAFFARV